MRKFIPLIRKWISKRDPIQIVLFIEKYISDYMPKLSCLR